MTSSISYTLKQTGPQSYKVYTGSAFHSLSDKARKVIVEEIMGKVNTACFCTVDPFNFGTALFSYFDEASFVQHLEHELYEESDAELCRTNRIIDKYRGNPKYFSVKIL